jgi:hypothetical protein
VRSARFLDLGVLALALPVFAIAGLPLIGWAAAAAAWLVQRGLQLVLERRARESDDVRTVAGLVAGSMVMRAWLVALAVFGIGLVDREAGLSAAVLAIVLFTVYFSTALVARPFDAR